MGCPHHLIAFEFGNGQRGVITHTGLTLLVDEAWLPMDRVAAQYRALLPVDREPTSAEIEQAFSDAYRIVLSSMLIGAA